MSLDRIGSQLDRMETKIDRLDERQDKVDIRLEQYNAQLEIHIKRSDALEAAVQPIIAFSQFIKTGSKVMKWSSAVVAAFATTAAILKKLFGF